MSEIVEQVGDNKLETWVDLDVTPFFGAAELQQQVAMWVQGNQVKYSGRTTSAHGIYSSSCYNVWCCNWQSSMMFCFYYATHPCMKSAATLCTLVSMVFLLGDRLLDTCQYATGGETERGLKLKEKVQRCCCLVSQFVLSIHWWWCVLSTLHVHAKISPVKHKYPIPMTKN